MRRVLIIFYLCAFLVPLSTVFAQVGSLATPQQPILHLDPQYPAPGDRVTVTLEDYSGVIDQSEIDWKLGSVDLPETKNARSISFVAGDALVNQTISASIRPRSGERQIVSSTFTPRFLDIVVEPQTYIPPLYTGRPLPTYGSIVRVSGLLNAKDDVVDPAGYSYLWKLNNKPINGGGVRGGYQTIYTVPYGRTHTVSLEVSDASGVTIAKRLVSVETTEVKTLLYEVSPLYGISQRIVSDPLQMVGNSLTVRAVPYNLDLRAFTNELFTQWSVAGRKVGTPGDKFEITLDRSGNGKSELEFEVRNLDELLQGDKADVTIQF